MKGQTAPKGANKQKKVDIHRREEVKGNNFTIIGFDCAQEAGKLLSHRGFHTWFYLMKNKNNFLGWELSSKDAVENWGFTDSNDFQKGVKELIDCGFLNLKSGAKYPNTWDFYEFTQDPSLKQMEDPSIKQIDGSEVKSTTTQQDPSIKQMEGASIKKMEGVQLNQLKGFHQTNGTNNIINNITNNINPIKITKEASDCSVGDGHATLSPYPSIATESSEQKEEELGSEKIEEPAVCHSISAIGQEEKTLQSATTANELPKAPIKPKSIGYVRRSRIDSDPTLHLFALDKYDGVEGAWIYNDGDKYMRFCYFTPENI